MKQKMSKYYWKSGTITKFCPEIKEKLQNFCIIGTCDNSVSLCYRGSRINDFLLSPSDQKIDVFRAHISERNSPRNFWHSNLHPSVCNTNRTRRPPVRIIRNEKKRPRSVTRARPGKIKFYGPRKRNVIARVPRRAANAHTASSVMGIGEWGQGKRAASFVACARARTHPLITN